MGQRFTVIAHANPTLFDVGAEGDSGGDRRICRNDRSDAGNADVVGADQGFGVRPLPGQRRACAWRNIFANGAIGTQGPGPDAAFPGAEAAIALTGGAGDDIGAKGERTVKPRAGADPPFTCTCDRVD